MALRSLFTRTVANFSRTGKTRTMNSYAPSTGVSPTSGRNTGLRGDFVPVYVALAMITLSVSLGLHTAKQQLAYSPAVHVRKKRRETVPEVVEPEHVAEEAENFFAKSFFRKVAHVQEFEKLGDYGVPYDAVQGDAFAHSHRIESLKSVGVDPTVG